MQRKKITSKQTRQRTKQPIRNGLFGGVNDSAGGTLQELLKDGAARINLTSCHAKYGKGGVEVRKPYAELLVVVSQRDSIVSIPRAIIPDGKGAYKVFRKNEWGKDLPPVTASETKQGGRLVGYLDVSHTNDPKNTHGETRWMVLRIRPRSPEERSGSFQFMRIPAQSVEDGRVIRKKLRKNNRMFSVPPFEIDPESWYNSQILRRLGMFMGRSPLPTSSLTRYHKWMSMTPREFAAAHSSIPNGCVPVRDSEEKMELVVKESNENAVVSNATIIETVCDVIDIPQADQIVVSAEEDKSSETAKAFDWQA